MNTITQSFAYLVMNNNGFFKNEKQAKTLLSVCNNSVFIVSGIFFGGNWKKFYYCDDKGVVMVVHHTNSKGDVIEWERASEGVKTVRNVKEAKDENRINREIKAIEKKIKETEEAWQHGDYAGYENLYHETLKRDNEALTAFKNLLG
jgi:uncharacterized protein YlxW (UPF0749 family)